MNNRIFDLLSFADDHIAESDDASTRCAVRTITDAVRELAVFYKELSDVCGTPQNKGRIAAKLSDDDVKFLARKIDALVSHAFEYGKAFSQEAAGRVFEDASERFRSDTGINVGYRS